ncbi:phosphoadenosine phosphosulfate reductase family protein [Ramlibacter albus]|uniref:phosphoadenosine phosphosulfate reductase family protein n=1 Tax=Ramlibacter albus TaxID=2079448 RepID=UPI001C9AA0E9|nr:phosphoadenosine phosphosulfate reductase family protein [Ramlibacter albus]
MNGDQDTEGELAASDAWLADQGYDLAALSRDLNAAGSDQHQLPDLDSYDHVLVAFSGGRDSLACLLHLLELGVPKEKIEAQHHLVDGREGSTFMDWPCTESYCEAVCKALGVKLTFSWRERGFLGEMLRDASPTAPMWFPGADGGYAKTGGKGPLGTRKKFPQVSANLAVRWCSSALKISCMDAYLANNPRFLGKRTLVITGERAEESASRSKYARFEAHRADTRSSKRVPRHIDVWRCVHEWAEQRVWGIIARWRLLAHPAYWLGYSRCSCRLCIFSSPDQWATGRKIAPAAFETVANYEREFKVTIHRTKTVTERADAGTPYAFDEKWVAIANSRTFDMPVFMDPWILPPGAYGNSFGPT